CRSRLHSRQDAVIVRVADAQVSSSFFFSATPSHCLASGGAAFFSVITGHFLDSSAFSFLNSSWPAGTSSSEKIASTGHSGSHSVQSMHSSGSITRKLGPSWKQSTGHTSTQSVYLHLIHASVTTNVIEQNLSANRRDSWGAIFCPIRTGGAFLPRSTVPHPRHGPRRSGAGHTRCSEMRGRP